MNQIDPDWLQDFDEALMALFATERSDVGMDAYLLRCYADELPWDAALAFGSDYDLHQTRPVWPPAGLMLHS